MPLRPATCCLILALSYASNLSMAWAGKADGRLDIYWIDVEGGAATLLVSPLGESVLIDTGNPGHRDPDRIVQTAVREAGLRALDHVIITHYHVDHFGGVAMLATMLPIKHLHDNGLFESIVERPDQSYLDAKVGQRSVISPGDVLPLANAPAGDAARLEVRCIGTRQEYMDAPANAPPTAGCAEAPPKPVDNSDNANSVVTLVSFGEFQFFDAGDLTWNLEKKLVCPANRIGVVDVYQAGHHGMDASNNPLLIRALEPTVAVINNGATKGCDPNMFAALSETKSVEAIYQVHRNLRPNDAANTQDEYIANAEKDCKAGMIKLSVDPSGKTYTVSVPSTGHSRTFTSK
ncbi:MAG: ComEC/Rec2 family competence protein [Pirellulales bacterium]